MSTGITAQLHKLMIIGIMVLLISPTIMINDNNAEITDKENEPILEEDTLSLTDGRVPDPNMMACPCPLYPSIANITNDDESPIDHLFVREGTGSVNDMTYPIDISWVQSGGTPLGEIWTDIDNADQLSWANYCAQNNPSPGACAGTHINGNGYDLWTVASETYDFYISDQFGVEDHWGQYLTIETYHDAATASSAVGNNIDTAYLMLADGTTIYATSVVMYELGTYNDAGNPTTTPYNGYVVNALGPADGEYTYVGNGWTKMVLCFGEFNDSSCYNGTTPNYDPEPLDPADPVGGDGEPNDPGSDGQWTGNDPTLELACPCPTYDSIVNITSGINNAPIDKFWAIEGTGGTYTYQRSINTGWIGSGFNPTGDLWEDIPTQDQRAESCIQSSGWSENLANADLKTQSKEAYDFYISDATGNLDPFGQYITIEVSHCKTTSLSAVGGNIDSAWIQLMDGTTIYPSQVVYYETGDNLPQGQPSYYSTPANGYVYNVLHSPDGEFTYMGNNWSKMVLCFAEYEGGVCANFGESPEVPDTSWPTTCECPMYETLMGMENANGATVESIGIREYTGPSYDVIYSNPDFYGPAVLNAEDGHLYAQSNPNFGNTPTWTPTSNLFVDTDDTAEQLLADNYWGGLQRENQYTLVDDTGYGLLGQNEFGNSWVLNHGMLQGGATWIYDLETRSNEVYDFYVSDELGNLDPNGQYLTIEVYHAKQTDYNSVGGNIDAVWVELSDGTMVYGKKVVHFEPGTYISGGITQPVPGHGEAILGAPDGSVTFMGNGYSKLVVCFGSNATGEDIVLKNTLVGDDDCDDCGDGEEELQSKDTSVLSGEVGKDNIVDLVVGGSVGALGAIILLRRKPLLG